MLRRTKHDLGLEQSARQRVLDSMADAIVNKLLHVPTMELKNHAARSDGVFLARSARHLFRLPSRQQEEDGEPQENKGKER